MIPYSTHESSINIDTAKHDNMLHILTVFAIRYRHSYMYVNKHNSNFKMSLHAVSKIVYEFTK